jgi:hypothetical protein
MQINIDSILTGRMKDLLKLLLLVVPMASLAQSTTSGDCSPAVGGRIEGNVTIVSGCKFDRTSIPPGLTPYTDDNEVFSVFFPTAFLELGPIMQRKSDHYVIAVGRVGYEGFWGMLWDKIKNRPFSWETSPQINGLVVGFFEAPGKSMPDEWWDNVKWELTEKTMFFGQLPKKDYSPEMVAKYRNSEMHRSVLATKRIRLPAVEDYYVVTRFDEADGMIMFAEAVVTESNWESYANPVFNSLLSIKWSPSRARTIVRRMQSKTRGLPEKTIERLESSTQRLNMSAAVTVRSDATVLLVEALYWGTRCLVEELSRDKARMAAAEAFLRRL